MVFSFLMVTFEGKSINLVQMLALLALTLLLMSDVLSASIWRGESKSIRSSL